MLELPSLNNSVKNQTGDQISNISYHLQHKTEN